MNIEGITLREAVADDLDAIALIYNSLWCNWIRKAGAWEDWALCGRFNAAMQLQRSPITLVAERNGAVVGACLVGVFDNGTPVRDPRWQPVFEELLAKATERAETADEDLEGSLFGDSREKATADRFAATGDEYAQAQINLIVIKPEWQGEGLGRRLVEEARRRMREAGCTRFFLMSDNRSNYHFYDHLGMARIAEDHSQDTGDNFVVYIYGGVA